MNILGFRSDQETPRYAIVAKAANGSLSLTNAESENRLVFPANITSTPQKLQWLYREFERIFREYQIALVVIKENEYTRNDNKAKRLASYIDAALILFCSKNQIPVEVKLYSSLGTDSSSVKSHAEHRVGKTVKHWNPKMADAVVAGWWGAK